ncbi:MAG: TolC family protein [Planctomycetes bacterium]|nr:TolC family protein [Planctomycetota bacterium]
MNLSVKFPSTKHQNRMIATAIIGGLLLVLPACRIPALRQAEPAPGQPAEFNIATSNTEAATPLAAVVGGFGAVTHPTDAVPTSTETSAQLGVEEFYNDPILSQLIQQAVANNRELKMMTEEVQIARNDILARKGAYLPFVTLGVGAGLDKPSLYTPLGAAEDQLLTPRGVHFPDPLGNFMGAFNFFWTPDIWRALHNARDAATQRYLAASERRSFFVTRLVADTAENYYRLMALDKRLEVLDQTIELQEQSYEIAVAKKAAGRGTELAVQRFQAELRKNRSEKLIVKQDIVEAENRINFLMNRFPQPVERTSAVFFDLTIHSLSLGLPAQLLQYRPDIRQAEHELIAAGLDIKVARARFLPAGAITAGVGYQAFNLQYLFISPEALIANVAGQLVAPVINRAAIKADYMTANARQLEAIYNYQRVILNAFTEVVNRMSMVENYNKSIIIKKRQLEALETSVQVASQLFQAARVEYIEVLFAQRDLLDARTVLIETKQRQLAAVVNTYQALGGGAMLPSPTLTPPRVRVEYGDRRSNWAAFCQRILHPFAQ